MTQRIYVLLGRAGDLINFMPVLWKEAQEGRRCSVMTTAPFDQIFDGISYADCIVYPGSPADITGAVEAAKKLSSDVVVVQTAGPEAEIKKHCFAKAATESFAKESWRLAGKLDLWKENLPLIFDKRDKARENDLLPDSFKKAIILYSTGGVSSKFQYATLLKMLLNLRFKVGFKLIDVSTIKAHRLYDLIGLMEKALFLVATDSAVLHLARAVPTLPVIALQADTPGLWNGSPWRPEYIWTCRYRDFPRRAPSMIEAIDKLYHGGLAYNPTAKRDTSKLIHVFSAYSGVAKEAKENWGKMYNENWIHSPVFFGAFGRDSRFGGVGDKSRYPFVKDVVRTAIMRAGAKDTIVLTRADTCFNAGEWFNGDGWHSTFACPVFSRRNIKAEAGLEHHPAIDLFAFTKDWWQKHVSEMPDMVMDSGPLWGRVLNELMLKHGGKEVPFLCHQAKKEEK